MHLVPTRDCLNFYYFNSSRGCEFRTDQLLHRHVECWRYLLRPRLWPIAIHGRHRDWHNDKCHVRQIQFRRWCLWMCLGASEKLHSNAIAERWTVSIQCAYICESITYIFYWFFNQENECQLKMHCSIRGSYSQRWIRSYRLPRPN